MTCEFDVIERLRRRFALVGDDCAVVDPPTGPLLLAADAVVEGVHFRPGTPAVEGGWRAGVAHVRGVGGMGGRPLHLLATVAAPDGADLERLVDGLAEAAAEYGCELAGGDLSATSGPLVVSVSVTGTVDDGGRAVLRSGARAGDEIYVTSP